jgi:hypothetical protein
MNNPADLPESRQHFMSGTFSFKCLPSRNGPRPKTIRGPLHIQCDGHGDPKYLNQIVDDALSWPHIVPLPSSASHGNIIPLRLEGFAATNKSALFITPGEFARILVGARTIYLVLPLISAHWVIVRGWAEPHYLQSFGLIPAGSLVVYTPRDKEELSVCYSLLFASYHHACNPTKYLDGAET